MIEELNLDWNNLKTQSSDIVNQEYQRLKSYFPEPVLNQFFTHSYSISKSPVRSYALYNFEEDYVKKVYEEVGLQKEWSDIQIFKNILLDLKKIDSVLQPIAKTMGMKYEIGLTGGALRDFFTGRSSLIKDLDIIFYISEWEYIPMGESAEILNKNFDEYYHNNVTKFKNLNISPFLFDSTIGTIKSEQFIFHMLSQLICKEFSIEYSFSPRALSDQALEALKQNIDKSGYENTLLRGVIKLLDDKLHYPVDILVSLESVASYTDRFDFNLCKIFLYFNEKNTLKSVKEDMSDSEVLKYIHRTYMTESFLTDLVYKKISLNPIQMDMDAVAFSLTDHYPRLQNKFPEYSLHIYRDAASNPCRINKKEYANLDVTQVKMIDGLSPNVADYVTRFVFYNQLNNQIPNKEQSDNIKKHIKKHIKKKI